jgi:hypothetical protein
MFHTYIKHSIWRKILNFFWEINMALPEQLGCSTDSMLPRTRHSQNHSRGHSRKQVVALPHSMALEARLSQLPQTTHNGTSDSTTHHMRRSTPARGPSSAVYATQQNARAGLLALSLRLTCLLVDCSDLIQRRMKQVWVRWHEGTPTCTLQAPAID